MIAEKKKQQKNLFPDIARKSDLPKVRKLKKSGFGKAKRVYVKTKSKVEAALKPKKKKSENKKLKAQCDEIWRLCIMERAGYKSELSGKPAVPGVTGNLIGLSAHHIVHKPNYLLRYDLTNGIALDSYSEHINGVHSNDPVRAREYSDKIIQYIGIVRWNELVKKRSIPSKAKINLSLVKEILTAALKEIRNNKT